LVLRAAAGVLAGLGATAAWPLATRAQQSATPVIGFLGSQSAELDCKVIAPFLQGLKETGYVEGQNVAVEYRYAENQYDRMPALAVDLVRRRLAVLVTASTPAALAAQAATTTIPIVFAVSADPVALSLVASLNRPGANLTGRVNLATAGRILKGEKPADLPVQQVTKINLVINSQDRQGPRPHHLGNAVGDRS
jgi:putative ABC transport system substrate-binding protein